MLNPLIWLGLACIIFVAARGRLTFWQSLGSAIKWCLGLFALLIGLLMVALLLPAWMNVISGSPDAVDYAEMQAQGATDDALLADPCINDMSHGVPSEYSRCTTPTPQLLHPTSPARQTATPRPSAGVRLYVTANALTVRAGPGGDYAAVGFLEMCDVVTLPTGTGDWLHVQTPVGAGYVARKYVSATADCN